MATCWQSVAFSASMTPAEIVASLTGAGFRLTVDGDRLLVSPRPNDADAATIRSAKPEIMAVLRESLPAVVHAFAALRSADPTEVRARGVCIACGAPWSLHASPAVETWRRVDDANEVALTEARAIVAAAAARRTR